MKTKNRVMAISGISVLLCLAFLVAIPVTAIATEQDDYVLHIYGNANEDDTIDMRDLTYVKLIFFGKKPETELADAKYDGKVNPLDFIQIKLIIVGKEKELTVIDDGKRIVTVKKPIKRIAITWRATLETLRSIKVSKDIIVGVPSAAIQGTCGAAYFDEFKDVPSVGNLMNPDVEAILNLDPDVVFLYGSCAWLNDKINSVLSVLEAADITGLRFYSSGGANDLTTGETIDIYHEEITKLGYILGKEDEAEEFRDFYESCLNPIIEKAEKIPEEDKPTVYYEGHAPYYLFGESWSRVEYAGGKNIFDIPYGKVDPEAVMERNPDIIVKMAPGGVTGYLMDPVDTTEIEKVREEIMSRPELRDVAAVKNGRVYVMSQYFAPGFGYSGARNFLQIAYQAKWFHPELFEDLDPKAIHQEYLTRFQRIDYDLDKHGVFVYPEPN